MMNEKIEETLKRLAAATQPGEMGNPLNNQPHPSASSDELAGEPNCPICGGLGYLRLDVPLGHPEFGRLQECTCRKERLSQQIRRRLFTLSNLDNLSHLTFENFQPRGRVGLGPWQADSLERAYNQARQFAQKLEVSRQKEDRYAADMASMVLDTIVLTGGG